MKIDIEYIDELRSKVREFNKLDLNDVEFHQNGQPITIPKEIVQNYKFMGLNNMDFVDMRFWLQEKDDDQ